jgi:hypothetical protein
MTTFLWAITNTPQNSKQKKTATPTVLTASNIHPTDYMKLQVHSTAPGVINTTTRTGLLLKKLLKEETDSIL